jgi:hypothetical protein
MAIKDGNNKANNAPWVIDLELPLAEVGCDSKDMMEVSSRVLCSSQGLMTGS